MQILEACVYAFVISGVCVYVCAVLFGEERWFTRDVIPPEDFTDNPHARLTSEIEEE